MRLSTILPCIGLLAVSAATAFAAQNNQAVSYNKTGAGLAQQQRYAAAVPYLREATVLDPTYEPAHRNLAQALLQTGDVDGAIKEGYTAAQLGSKDPYAYAYLAQAYMAKGNVKEAVESAEDGVRIAPSNGEIVSILGAILDQAGMSKDAVTQFKYAIRVQPGCYSAHTGLGDAYLHLTRYAEAIDEFRRGIRLYRNYPYAHLELGLALYKSGHDAEARAEWSSVLKMSDPNSAQLAKSYLDGAAGNSTMGTVTIKSTGPVTIKIQPAK
jgi:tetratricopeptide (TPR) repeat protein